MVSSLCRSFQDMSLVSGLLSYLTQYGCLCAVRLLSDNGAVLFSYKKKKKMSERAERQTYGQADRRVGCGERADGALSPYAGIHTHVSQLPSI